MTAPTPPSPPQLPPYATYVEDRKPKFKAHKTLGNARGAVVNHYPANNVWVYELGPDGWRVIEEYLIPDACAWCGGGWEYVSYGTRAYSGKYRPWGDRHLKMYEKPIICHACYRKTVDDYNAEKKREQDLKQLAALERQYRNV